MKVVQDNETKKEYAAKFLNISSQFGYSSYNEIQILKYFKQFENSPAVELIDTYESDGKLVAVMVKYQYDFKGLQRL